MITPIVDAIVHVVDNSLVYASNITKIYLREEKLCLNIQLLNVEGKSIFNAIYQFTPDRCKLVTTKGLSMDKIDQIETVVKNNLRHLKLNIWNQIQQEQRKIDIQLSLLSRF